MSLTKSAKKALRVNRKRKVINDLTRAKIKSALKGAKLAIARGESGIEEKISLAYRELDLAAKKHVIHKNRASRLKSRLAKKLAKMLNNNQPTKARAKTASKTAKAKKTPVSA